MNKLGKTGILLIVAFSVTAVALGIYTFFFAATKQKAQEATLFLTKAEDIESKREKLASIFLALKEQSSNIEKLDQYFIKEDEIVSFAKKVEALGVDAGTKVSLETLAPGVGKDGLALLNFNIEAQGNFVNIMRTLELLENFPAKIEWSTVKISRENGGGVILPRKKGVPPQALVPEWKLVVTAAALNFKN